MSWIRLDDQFPENAKVAGLHDRAFRFHVTALCYSARNLTDGVITVRGAGIVAAILGTTAKRWPRELEEAGLWHTTDDGWEINDYHEYQATADYMKELARKRSAAGRVGGLASAEAKREANRQRTVEQTRPSTVLNPTPSPLEALALPPLKLTVPSAAGVDNSPLGKLRRACRVLEGSTDEAKLVRAMRHVSEADVVDISFGAQRPEILDRLGWTLSELKKRRAA